MGLGYSQRHRRAADAGRRAAARYARTTTVTVVVETFDRPVHATGAVLLTTETVEISPRPRVTPVGDAGASYFGGGYSSRAGGALAEEYEIGPITLDYAGGGYAVADVLRQGAADVRVRLRLSGPAFDGNEYYELVPGSLVATRPHQFTFRVRRTEQ